VVAIISAHHLHLIVDDWAGHPMNYCKPVAKTFADRTTALPHAASSGNPKFFFGSDSAPHPITSKRGKDKIAAGVFTQPYATQIGYGGARNRQSRQESKKKEDVTLEKIKWVHERVWLRAREIKVVQTDSKGRRRLKISYRMGTEACKSCHFGEEERRRGIP